MARTKYNTPQAERIFNTNDVSNRMASPTGGMPDEVAMMLQQEMQDKLTNPDNAVAPPKKKMFS